MRIRGTAQLVRVVYKSTMYLPPLCLEVMKNELAKLFAFEAPPQDSEDSEDSEDDSSNDSEGSTDESEVEWKQWTMAKAAGKEVVAAARCAASLALCGNAQLTELALSLYDRVVDPGCVAAAAAALERDVQERAAASASLEALRVATEVCYVCSDGKKPVLPRMREVCKAAGLPTSGTRLALTMRVAMKGPAMHATLAARLALPSGGSSCPVRPRLKGIISGMVQAAASAASAASKARDAKDDPDDPDNPDDIDERKKRRIQRIRGRYGRPWVYKKPPTVPAAGPVACRPGPAAGTISLLDAMFVYRLPFETLDGLPPQDFDEFMYASTTVEWASRRLRIEDVLEVALARTMIARAGRAARSDADAASDADPAKRDIVDLFRRVFPDDPPETTDDCMRMLMDIDERVRFHIWLYLSGRETGRENFRTLAKVERLVRKAIAVAERRHALGAALDREGLLPSDTPMLYLELTGPVISAIPDLDIDRVVTSARFGRDVRFPIFAEHERDFQAVLKHLWLSDVCDAYEALRNDPSIDPVVDLTVARDRMWELVRTIDEVTLSIASAAPGSPGSLADVVKLPKGSVLWTLVTRVQAQVVMKRFFEADSKKMLSEPYPSALAMLEKFLAVTTAELAKDHTRLRTCTRDQIQHDELSSFADHQFSHGTFTSYRCPLCRSTARKKYTLVGLLFHLIESH
jgi:hypothetical protein